MTAIRPEPGETPMEALVRVLGREQEVFFWDEPEDLVPATDAEMRAGVKEAMERFAEFLPSPQQDNCECLTCRSFRKWLASDASE